MIILLILAAVIALAVFIITHFTAIFIIYVIACSLFTFLSTPKHGNYRR